MTIALGRMPSKGWSACLGVVPLSNNVLWTDILLKPLRKERIACPGMAFNDNVKRTKENNQWDRGSLPLSQIT